MTNAPALPATGQSGTVYLVHLEHPYHHARHYLGWALDVDQRLTEHREGRGSPLLRAATMAGIDFRIARTWPETDRYFERQLKSWHKSSQLCPLCQHHAPSAEPANVGSHGPTHPDPRHDFDRRCADAF